MVRIMSVNMMYVRMDVCMDVRTHSTADYGIYDTYIRRYVCVRDVVHVLPACVYEVSDWYVSGGSEIVAGVWKGNNDWLAVGDASV